MFAAIGKSLLWLPGRMPDDLSAKGVFVLVAAHLPVLTVRETLQFSRTCQQRGESEFSAVQEVRKLQQTGSKVHAAGADLVLTVDRSGRVVRLCSKSQSPTPFVAAWP